MRLQTIPEAARALGRSAQQLRRRVQAGHYPHYEVGGRVMVDVDELARIVEMERGSIGIAEAAQLTGLSINMIRRGVRGGYLPHIEVGGGYRFVPAQLLEALEGKKNS